LWLQVRGYLAAGQGTMTERPDPLLDHPRPAEPTPLSPLRDPLSDVLRTVRLRGSVFFMLDMSSPWAAGMPDGTTLAPILVPQAQQVLSFHVIARGSCWGGLLGQEPLRFEAGKWWSSRAATGTTSPSSGGRRCS
jgi:hypothetical protein